MEEDCKDIWNGVYREIEIDRRIKGEKGQRGLKLDELRFYPLDRTLSPIVQLFLRCKELNYLIDKIQKSLVHKMSQEGTMSNKDKQHITISHKKREEDWYETLLEKGGQVRLQDGQVMKREKWEKGEKREKLWREK